MGHSSVTNVHCQLRETYRSCEGLLSYGDHEGKRYCVLHLPSKDKDDDDFQKEVRKKLLGEKHNFAGVYFPSKAKFRKVTFKGEADFSHAVFEEEANFSYAVFEDSADFSEALFKGGADSSETKFNEKAKKEKARSVDFRKAIFKKEADFSRATFEREEARFRKAIFEGEADFSHAVFEEEAKFRKATFKGSVKFEQPEDSSKYSFNKRANFSMASFEKQVEFVGKHTFNPEAENTTFRGALIEKSELFSLDRVQLRPSWFIDANVRKFRFTNVRWWGLPNEPTNGPKGSIKGEIQAIRVRRTKAAAEPKADRDSKEDEDEKDLDSQLIDSYAPGVLAMTCRELTANAEENRDYPTANEFHYWAMDALRIGSWSALYKALLKKEVRQCINEGKLQDITSFWALRFGDLDAKALLTRETWQNIRNRERFGLINSLYWVLSGYGVRPLRACMVLLIMSLVFALLYSWPYIEAHYSLQAFEGLTYGYWGGPLDYLGYFLRTEMYSLGALARLNPEPKPTPGLFQTLVIAAGILGPLQVGLLLLAIRRKIMR